jgi:hypothetical protein
MNCRYEIVTLSKVGQFSWFLKPGSLKKRIKGILSTAVNDTRANNENLNILSLEGENLVLDLLDVLVFWQRDTRLIVHILPKCILNRFLFHRVFFIFGLFFLFTCLFALVLLIFLCILWCFFLLLFWLSALFCILLVHRRWKVFLNLSIRVAPYHNVTDKDKCFVILKRFFHHFEAEFDIRNISLINVVDEDFALFCGFFSKEFGLLSFEDFFNTIGLCIKRVLHGTHVDRVLNLFLNKFA